MQSASVSKSELRLRCATLGNGADLVVARLVGELSLAECLE
jgi:hypothetical protein